MIGRPFGSSRVTVLLSIHKSLMATVRNDQLVKHAYVPEYGGHGGGQSYRHHHTVEPHVEGLLDYSWAAPIVISRPNFN